MTEPEKVQLSDFACSCHEPHSRGGEHLHAVRRWAEEKFNLTSTKYERVYVTRALHRLDDHFDAIIEDIYCDQWCVMHIRTPEVVLSMQFDMFEDGLCLALRRLWKWYGRQDRDEWKKAQKVDTAPTGAVEQSG